MKKSKIMAIMLSAAMAVGMLGGCGSSGELSAESGSGSGSEAESESQAGDEPTSEASEASGQEETGEEDGDYYVDEDGNRYKKFDDVQLKMLICWNGGFPTASDQYNNDVAKTIRDKIGVTVEFEGIIGRMPKARSWWNTGR